MRSSPENPAVWFPPDLKPEHSVPERIADGVWAPPELTPTVKPREGSGAGASGHASSRDASYESGYSDGLRDGAARAENELREIIQALGQAAEAFHNVRLEFLRDLERNVHALAVTVARKIVQREVSSDPSLTEELVHQALKLLPQEASIDLRLNPDDLVRIQEGFQGDRNSAGGPKIQWVADPSIDRGGFLLVSPLRLIDGRVDVALRTLYERLEHD